MRLVAALAVASAIACAGPVSVPPPATPAPAPLPPASAAPPIVPAAPPPTAAPSAAVVPAAASGRTGRCEAGEESPADDGQPGGYGFSIEVQDGKITKANYFVVSGMGHEVGDLAGATGPAVRDGEWTTVTLQVEAPHGDMGQMVMERRTMRLRIDGSNFQFAEGDAASLTGGCRWNGSAPAPAAPAPRVVPITIQGGDHEVTLTADGTTTKCATTHTQQAALASCEVHGRTGQIYLGFGASDDAGKVMCGRAPGQYQFQHGGGWNDGTFANVGGSGAIVQLSPDVTLWFDGSLGQVVVTAPGSGVQIAMDPAGEIFEVQQVPPGPRPNAPVVADLTQPAPKNAQGCQ